MAERTLELYIGIRPHHHVGHYRDYPTFSSFIDGKIAGAGKLDVGNPDDYWHGIAMDMAKLIKEKNLSGYKIFNNGTIPTHDPDRPGIVKKTLDSRVLALVEIIDSELKRNL